MLQSPQDDYFHGYVAKFLVNLCISGCLKVLKLVKMILVSTEKVKFYIGLARQIETKLEKNISIKNVELRTRKAPQL